MINIAWELQTGLGVEKSMIFFLISAVMPELDLFVYRTLATLYLGNIKNLYIEN